MRQAEADSGPGALDTARAANTLASLYLAWGRPEKAESFAARADTILRGKLTGLERKTTEPIATQDAIAASLLSLAEGQLCLL